MVEREHGSTRTAGDAEATRVDEFAPAPLGGKTTTGVSGDADTEGSRFLEALDEVMEDHHNVLAALAK